MNFLGDHDGWDPILARPVSFAPPTVER